MFSLIIPVYNVAPYLRECLDSVFSQDFKDYEVCIVDDGSTDESGAICKEYKTRYGDRVKLYHQVNQGVSVARNKALDMASGEWIWFVDGDDYILPGALTYLQEIIHQSNCETIFFGNIPYEKGNKVQYNTGERSQFLATHVCYLNQNMIFHRPIIEHNKLRFTVGMKMDEDLEFQYKYLMHCRCPVSIEYNCYGYRVRKGSASRNPNSLKNGFDGNEKLLINIANYLKDNPTIKIDSWIYDRICERLNKYIYLASLISDVDWKHVQQTVDSLISTYSLLGFSNIKKGRFYLARVSVRLYGKLYLVYVTCRRYLRRK